MAKIRVTETAGSNIVETHKVEGNVEVEINDPKADIVYLMVKNGPMVGVMECKRSELLRLINEGENG